MSGLSGQVKKEMLIIAVCAIFGFFISRLILYYFNQEGKYVNCELSEISPDISPAMKESCRKMKYDHKQK